MSNLVENLSTREQQIYEALLTGASNKAIAEEFCIALQTVKYHMAQIFKKLEVSNRSEAVAYGLRRSGAGAVVVSGVEGAYTIEQIKEAAALLVEKKCGSRKVVNQVVVDLLAALEGKL